jgi:eukaryotic-like serine/threonine-protein kinase
VRVMDFGLAGGIDDGASGAFVGMTPEDIELATHSGAERSSSLPASSGQGRPNVVGTPAYMAPEQHDGQATDARSDQFSFCVTAFEALHGVRPFRGETPKEIAAAVRAGDIRSPPEGSRVPTWMHNVILRGLSVRPEDRYPSMQALLTALRADPAIRRRRWLARGALGLLALPALFGIRQAVLAWTADPCAGAGTRIEKVWGEPQRARVQTAFATVDKPYVADVWKTVSVSLDRYAASWFTMHREACEANKVRGEESDALLDLRMQCLARRLAELDALVDLLGEADEALVRSSVEASYALVPVDVCADVDALRAPVPPPDAADARAVLDEVRQQLAQAKALEDAGRLTEGLALVSTAVDRARTFEYAPLLAEALLQHGRLGLAVADLELAEQQLREAVQVAARGKHHEVEARAWIALVMVVGYGQAKPELGAEIARAAMAAVSRAGDPVELRADLANSRGAVALQRNSVEEAETLFRETLLLERLRLGEDHPKTANALNNHGLVMMYTKRYEEARSDLRAAIEIYEQTYGETHPKLARLRLNLASTAAALGHHGEAQTQAQRALEISLREFGPDHVDTGLVSLVLAELDLRQRRFERTKERASDAVRILEPKLEDHPHLAVAKQLLGAASRELGEHLQAIALLESAVAMAERTLDGSDPTLLEVRVELADAYVRGGRFEEATEILEEVLSELPEDADRGRKGRIVYVLAQALWHREAERPRALTLAHEAREELTDPSPAAGLVPTVDAVDRWLASR